MSTAFLILPIPSAHLDQVRASGRDVSGNPVQVISDMPEQPLRCCLQNSRAGERLILFGYEPPIPGSGSPYREVGPVFAHADDCAAPPVWTAYPQEWVGHPQVLRAYDSRGWIHPATTTHNGSDPESALSTVLATPEVVTVHSRNIAHGCFMFVATTTHADN